MIYLVPTAPRLFHVCPKGCTQTRAPCDKPALMVPLTSFHHVSAASTVTGTPQ